MWSPRKSFLSWWWVQGLIFHMSRVFVTLVFPKYIEHYPPPPFPLCATKSLGRLCWLCVFIDNYAPLDHWVSPFQCLPPFDGWFYSSSHLPSLDWCALFHVCLSFLVVGSLLPQGAHVKSNTQILVSDEMPQIYIINHKKLLDSS